MANHGVDDDRETGEREIAWIKESKIMSDWTIQNSDDGTRELIIDVYEFDEPYETICDEIKQKRKNMDETPMDDAPKSNISSILSSAASMGYDFVSSIV